MTRTCVCVPVRDEREQLPGLLRALSSQQGVEPGGWAACFHLDRCADGSADLLRAFASTAAFPILIEEGAGAPEPNAGRARRAAMALGAARVSTTDGVLLTTDADSAPAPDWIARARAALLDAHLVAGRIVRRNAHADPQQTRLEAYYDRLYALRRRLDPAPWEPGPGHHFTGGANLGFRAEVYAALGGFSAAASGEDALIVDQAARAGFRVRRDAAVVVETSSRREGRAPGGLAAALREGACNAASEATVGHPADEAWRYGGHAAARDAYASLDRSSVAADLAARLGLPRAEVAQVAGECRNAEAFATRIVPSPPGGLRRTSLAEAERALAALERELQDAAA